LNTPIHLSHPPRETRVDSRFENAFRDCSTAYDIDQSNHKALFRRAEALVGMGRREQALVDYRVCLEKVKGKDPKVQARIDELVAAGVDQSGAHQLPAGSIDIVKLVLRVYMPFAKERHSHYLYRGSELNAMLDILGRCHSTIDEVSLF
jgi:hypothetical protein